MHRPSKNLALELGENAPLIIFEDADLDKAVQGAMLAKYRNAGQTCVCANRIYAHKNIYAAFSEKFVTAVKALKVGNGLDEGTQIGPLINEKQYLKSAKIRLMTHVLKVHLLRVVVKSMNLAIVSLNQRF